MIKIIQKSLIVGVLISTALLAFADRGVGKKTKTKISLNIASTTSLRSSISYNLKSGLSYKGALNTASLLNRTTSVSSTVVTYQKGNTVYIIPYKQKIVMPELKQGYVGMKLIIQPHK